MGEKKFSEASKLYQNTGSLTQFTFKVYAIGFAFAAPETDLTFACGLSNGFDVVMDRKLGDTLLKIATLALVNSWTYEVTCHN